MQVAWMLNGTNINQDYMVSMGTDAMLSAPGAVLSGLIVTANTVAIGKAIIYCTRTSGEVVMLSYSNTASVTIDTTGTKKVYILADQAKIDNGYTNATDGTGIAVITTGPSYPSGNYIPLASVVSGVITNERPVWVKQNKKSVNIASSTATDLSWVTGSTAHITGTTTITSFGILPAGTEICLIFDGILTLTNNATSLILPGGASITTAVGDTAYMVSEGSGNWKCVWYQKASGLPLVQWGTIITWEVRMWTTATPPTSWFICDGTAKSRTTYAALFAVIGTTFGVGDGSTTFNIPDFRGRSPIGSGTGSAVGATARSLWLTPTTWVGGEEKHTLDVTEIPTHTHTIQNVQVWTGWSYTSVMSQASNNPPWTSTSTGSIWGWLGHNIISPITTINFIIAQ